jgi:hypothetical protein
MTEESANKEVTLSDGTMKLRFSLLPIEAVMELLKAYEYGAKKYSDNNWKKGLPFSTVFNALLRHVWAWWRGEDRDPESGCHHLAHAAFWCLASIYYGINHPQNDDRSK